MSARSHTTGPSPFGDLRDHAGLADALLELDAEVGQLAGDDPGGARLLEREFRMPVQIDVEGFEVERHVPEPTEAPPGVSRAVARSSRAR